MLPNHAAARRRRAVRHARGAAPRPHRPRHRAGAGHRPGHGRRAAPLARRRCGAEDFPRRPARPDGDARRRAHRARGLGAVPAPHRWRRRARDRAARLERLLGASSPGSSGSRFAFAHHFDVAAGRSRRSTCTASTSGRRRRSTEPYTIVTAGVLAADDAEEAEYLAGPARLAMLGIRTGRRDRPAVAPTTPPCTPTSRRPGRCRRTASSATPTRSPTGCAELADRTEADEIMLSTMTHGLAERIRTLELVAERVVTDDARWSCGRSWRWRSRWPTPPTPITLPPFRMR